MIALSKFFATKNRKRYGVSVCQAKPVSTRLSPNEIKKSRIKK